MEDTLFGRIDRVETAVERLRAVADLARGNHPRGFAVMDSGGKDSDVIKQIAFLSGVPFEIIHSHTTADHPLTVRYVREEQRRWEALGVPYRIAYPMYQGRRTSMWDLISIKGAPTRVHRWCCEFLKKYSAGDGRFTVTGVRWSESAKRKNCRTVYEFPSRNRGIGSNSAAAIREQFNRHRMGKGQFVTSPIIDWTDSDVWEFHELYGLPHNPLYDKGFQRVGCVGCPMGQRGKLELVQMPEFEALYVRAFQRFLDSHPHLIGKNGWDSGRGMYDWWVGNKPLPLEQYGQLTLEQEAA